MVVPAAIKWGQDNEHIARQKYFEHMQNAGHFDIKIRQCGFFVHPEKCWLGASPDGVVTDPPNCTGVLKIKCPYSVREMPHAKTPLSIADDGAPRLKRTHGYYHQVQLELYVCSDQCSWCDFCVYTTKGIIIDRIYPDQEWVKKNIPELKEYYYKYILPELVISYAQTIIFL